MKRMLFIFRSLIFLSLLIVLITLIERNAALATYNKYESSQTEKLAEGAFYHLKDYTQKKCLQTNFDLKWNQLATQSLKNHGQSKESISQLLITLESYISNESICRHIFKSVTVLAQCRGEYIEKIMELYSQPAQDKLPYLSHSEILRHLNRSLAGFAASPSNFAKIKDNLKSLDKQLGSDTLRANFSRGLSLVSLIDPEEVLKLQNYLVQESKLITQDEFEKKLQTGLSVYGKKDLAEQVSSIVTTLKGLGFSTYEIRSFFLENAAPFVHSKPGDIKKLFETYTQLLKKQNDYLKGEKSQQELSQMALSFISQKLYLTTGLHVQDINEFLALLERPELNLNPHQVLEVFTKALADISSNKIDWSVVRGNIGGLLRLKSENQKPYFNSSTLVTIIKKYIILLNQAALSNILLSKTGSDSLRYSKVITLMSDIIVQDPDQIPHLKNTLYKDLNFSIAELKNFLKQHSKSFISTDETFMVKKIKEVESLMKPYLPSKRFKPFLINTFDKWLSIEDFDRVALIVDSLATLYKSNESKSNYNSHFPDVIDIIISRTDLINLSLEDFEKKLLLAEELKNWGFSTSEALVQVFEKQELLSNPLDKISPIETRKKRELFSAHPGSLKFTSAALASFLKHQENEILATSIEHLEIKLKEAKKLKITSQEFEHWVQAGYLLFTDISASQFQLLFEALNSIYSTYEIRDIIAQAYIEIFQQIRHISDFKSSLTPILKRLTPTDLSWLKPHIHLLLSQRGINIAEFIIKFEESNRTKLSSHHLGKILYLGSVDKTSFLNPELILRATSLAEPISTCEGLLKTSKK